MGLRRSARGCRGRRESCPGGWALKIPREGSLGCCAQHLRRSRAGSRYGLTTKARAGSHTFGGGDRSRPPLSHAAGRDRRLAERDAAVVRRQAPREQHPQPGRSSSAGVRSSSRRFWNTPPDSTTVSSPRRSAATRAGARGRVGERAVEARRDRAGRDAAARSATTSAIVARASSNAAARPSRRRAAGRRRARPGSAARLELGRRLALVVDDRADAAERGDRVEQPPDARRRRRRRARPHERARPRSSASGRPRSASAAGSAGRAVAERVQPGARHAPRLAHRGVAAGQAHRPQVPGALEAVEPADQQLAAPDRAVARRARCRRRSRRPPGRVSPCSARQAARCAWWCWTRDAARRPRARARRRSRGSRGAGRARRAPARPRTAARSARCPRGRSAASPSS